MVKKYRNKPEEVEAIVWNGDFSRAIYDFLTGTEGQPMSDRGALFYTIDRGHEKKVFLTIRTPETDRMVRDGDFIVKTSNGDLHIYKPDKFAATYEPAE